MPLFVKTESFKPEIFRLLPEQKSKYLQAHIKWVKELSDSGTEIASGYLVDGMKRPGGGGLLILQAKNYDAAKNIILQDPMIKNNLVDWNLQEWQPVFGELLKPIITSDKHS